MYNTARDTLDALRAGPEVLEGLLSGITEEQARAARGGDENWSVVEVVCHLRDAEECALERMRAMRDEQNPFLPAYDQDTWARERRYSEANLQEAFEAFRQFRAQFVADLEALNASDWERPGQHAEAGRITILNHALHLAAHDAIHAAQIARQLAAAR